MIKYLLTLKNGSNLALRAKRIADSSSLKMSIGGYTKNLEDMYFLARFFFGVRQPRKPQYVQRNKCWLHFNSNQNTLDVFFEEMKDCEITYKRVTGFGNLTR